MVCENCKRYYKARKFYERHLDYCMKIDVPTLLEIVGEYGGSYARVVREFGIEENTTTRVNEHIRRIIKNFTNLSEEEVKQLMAKRYSEATKMTPNAPDEKNRCRKCTMLLPEGRKICDQCSGEKPKYYWQEVGYG